MKDQLRKPHSLYPLSFTPPRGGQTVTRMREEHVDPDARKLAGNLVYCFCFLSMV